METQRKRQNAGSLRGKSGFSILEVIIVVAIAASIIFVISSFRGNVDIIQNFVSAQLQSRQDVEQTLQILMTEIRSAGPSGLGGYPVESASTSSFVFFSDIDKDGVFERVRYSFGTSTMVRGVIEPVGNPLVYATSSEIIKTAIANIVQNASTTFLEYFGASATSTGTPLAQPVDVSAIRMVRISLFVDIQATSTPKPEFFTNTVTVRNLRSN